MHVARASQASNGVLDTQRGVWDETVAKNPDGREVER